MEPTRRTFLATGTAALAAAALPRPGQAAYAPRPGPWRRFELATRVTLPLDGRAGQLWVPVPALAAEGWSRPDETTWRTDAAEAALARDPETGAQFLHARWPAGRETGRLYAVSHVDTRSRAVDLSRPRSVPPLPPEARARHTAPTALIPTDGIVAETASRVTAGAGSDLDKARAIYDWVVESTARNPETRGCGLGDIASMLRMGDLTGKCADLNALFVGLARASGLPARDLYGLRVAPSAFGYESLGAGSIDVTSAQHCRADVWLEGFGWVPADPADVRKVVLEEPPQTLSLGDAPVRDVRAALFGAAESNWVALNAAHDVPLPGAPFGPVPFLMYPEAEIGGRRRDPLAPDDFAYTITAAERPA